MSSCGGAADAESVLSTLATEIQRYLSPSETLSGVSSCSSSLRSSFFREVAWRRLCLRDFPSFLSTEPSVSTPRPRRRRGEDSPGHGDNEDGVDDSPATWQLLYSRLKGLEEVRWNKEVGGSGTSPDLRSDPCEYGPSDDGTVLIRSGGKYFFVVSVLPLRDFHIVCQQSRVSHDGSNEGGRGGSDGKQSAEDAADGAPVSSGGSPDAGCGVTDSDAASIDRSAATNPGAPIDPERGAENCVPTAPLEHSKRTTASSPPSSPSAHRKKYSVCAGRWSKIRTKAADHPCDVPSPRTGHTLTPLPCGRRLALFGGRRPDVRHGIEAADDTVYLLTMESPDGANGGDGNGGPLSCDDLGSGPRQNSASFTAEKAPNRRGAWSRPRVAGNPPSPRFGHSALPLWKAPGRRMGEKSRRRNGSDSKVQIAVVGGTKGTSPINHLEVYILDLTDPEVALWSSVRLVPSPSGRPLPTGRFGHEAFFSTPSPRRDSSQFLMGDDDHASSYYDIVVFGGRQYSVTLGFLDSWRGTLCLRKQWSSNRLKGRADAYGPTHPDAQCAARDEGEWEIAWHPQREGDGPGPRRGHSAYALGRKLVVFGGAADVGDRQRSGGELASSEVWVMDAAASAAAAFSNVWSSRPPALWYVPETTTSKSTGAEMIATDAAAPKDSDPEDNSQADPKEDVPPRTNAVTEGGSPSNSTSTVVSPVVAQVPAPRRGHSARIVCGRLVISGGYGVDGEKLNNREGYELCFC